MAWAWSAWAGDPPFLPSPIALHASLYFLNTCFGAAAHAWGPGDVQQGILWHGPGLLGQVICHALNLILSCWCERFAPHHHMHMHVFIYPE